MVGSTSDVQGSETGLDRLRSTICRRAFSSPEAFGYELAIAPAVLAVASQVVPRAGLAGSVLDVGSGGGRLAAHLARAGGCSVTCMDPSWSQLRRVQGRRGDGLALRAVGGEAGGLPFRAGSVDAVVSCCALKHWPDPGEGLQECRRVLRPGGRLLVVEIAGESSVDDFQRFTELTRIPIGLRRAYVRFAMRTVVAVAPRTAEVATLLGRAGLASVQVHKLDELPFLVALATGS